MIRLPRLALLLLASLAPAAEHHELADKVTTALKDTGAPSVSVALVEHGQLAWAQAFGKANIADNRAADTNTRYAVGSISKQFTVAAILLLQEQGKLSLDDKVAKYFPDLTDANEVTIRELLSHTSGYEDYAPQDYMIPEWTHATTPQVILERWAKKPLNFKPGAKWQYSNTNYVLAGEIFEKASGEGLLAFLREKIFEPLHMTSAGDCSVAGADDATAYTRYGLGPPRVAEREGPGWYFAAGELCMTASDLARWDIAFLRHQILSAASYEEFTREVKLPNGDRTHYALGLSIGELRNMPTISHGGEVSGFLALNTVFPNRDGAVVMLSNEDDISLIGPLSDKIAVAAFLPEQSPVSETEIAQVRGILEGLQNGRVDHALFTDNANSYFTDAALQDFRSSLTPLGKLKTVTRLGESLRGGMIHRTYHADFTSKTVLLNIYVMPDGKYEQFLVEEQL